MVEEEVPIEDKERLEKVAGNLVKENKIDSFLKELNLSTGEDGTPPKVKLKELPKHLKYAFLGAEETYPVIIASELPSNQEEKLLKELTRLRKAIGWSLDDIRGISPSMCMHHINLEEEAKPIREHQRRLNPNM